MNENINQRTAEKPTNRNYVNLISFTYEASKAATKLLGNFYATKPFTDCHSFQREESILVGMRDNLEMSLDRLEELDIAKDCDDFRFSHIYQCLTPANQNAVMDLVEKLKAEQENN